MRGAIGWAVCAWILVGGCSLSSHENGGDAATMDAGDASTGPTAEIVGALTLDQECVVSTDANFLLSGLFDVTSTNGCGASNYQITLLINNFVPEGDVPDGGFVGAGPDPLHFTDATVSLSVDGSLLPTGTLPNPFHVLTFATVAPARNGTPGIGLVSVEVIPVTYRPTLTELGTLGGRVTAEVTLTATIVNGVTVEPETFRFPIQLCVGCLHRCESELTPEEIDGLTNGICRDNAGADGRFCIDSSC